MVIATLGIILGENGKEVLLGEKKKGRVGTGVLSGPGGGQEPGETLEECLIRETQEELELVLDSASLELVAVIDFYAAGALDFSVYIYHAKILFGEIKETADMIPGWYPVDDLPFDRMFGSDRYWFEKAVRGEKFRANVYYYKRAKGFIRIEFLPFSV